MIQTWNTGSTISCLWPPRADHAVMPVMMPRKSDSDMCRDGANTANMRSEHPVDEHGGMHGVSDLNHFANALRLLSNRGRLLAMKERWRWRKLRKSGSQIGMPPYLARTWRCFRPARPLRPMRNLALRTPAARPSLRSNGSEGVV